MSNNNNIQPPDPESLVVFNKAQAPSTTRAQSAEASTTAPTVDKLDYDGISLVERRSTTTPIIDCITEVNQGESDDATIRFLLDCAKRGHNRGNQRRPSICKVSRILRDLGESSFIPQLISIGPIHREDPKLKEFEWLKECYLDDLLNRFRFHSTPKETILEACLQKVNTLIPKIRESYAGMIKNYDDVELARMMVMDGCFILEFCFKHEAEDMYLPNQMENVRIAMDLMLLENQVPFSVLQALFDCSMGEEHFTLSDVLDAYLAPYIKLFHPLLPEKISSNVLDKYLARYLKLFHPQWPEISSNVLDKSFDSDCLEIDSTPDHVLGYLHKRFKLAKASKPSDEERIENTVYHSIVELDRSGMNFKPHQEDVWSMTIKFQSSLFAWLPWFWSKPTLLLPTLVIDDFTELILRNFIAYEQSFPKDHYYFTSYAYAMDTLIDAQEDIAKLAESKVLVNTLGSNQEAADMINKICKNVFVKDFVYIQEFKQMDKYYNRFWRKHITRLMTIYDFEWLRRVYLNNPWNFIALIAAIILFIVTVVQTIFTVLEYFR